MFLDRYNFSHNDRWWEPRPYNLPESINPWKPPEGCNKPWKTPEEPKRTETYYFDGQEFPSRDHFEAYLAKKLKEKDKNEAIAERLKDPYENSVQDQIDCPCGKELSLFAIPYQLTRDGKIYEGHIYIEFCIHCDDFATRCKEGRETYLAIAAAELDSKKNKSE